MNAIQQKIDIERRRLARCEQRVVNQANRYERTRWLEEFAVPNSILTAFEGSEAVENELLRCLDERTHVRKSLARELRQARAERRA